jgi:hypothetical protein
LAVAQNRLAHTQIIKNRLTFLKETKIIIIELGLERCK